MRIPTSMPNPGPGLILPVVISLVLISPAPIPPVPISRARRPAPIRVPMPPPVRTSRRPDARRGPPGCGVPLPRSSRFRVPPRCPRRSSRWKRAATTNRSRSVVLRPSRHRSVRPGPIAGERAPMQDGWVRPRGPVAPAPAAAMEPRGGLRAGARRRRRASRSRRFPTYSTWSGPMTVVVPPAKARRRPNSGRKHPSPPDSAARAQSGAGGPIDPGAGATAPPGT